MVINQLNDLLRQIFGELVEKGYKKKPMADVTLGSSFGPQFNKFFVEKTDLGLSPLTRMVEGLGYELHLVPIKQDDEETKKLLESQYETFESETKEDLINYLDNRPAQTRSSGGGKVSKAFDDHVDDIFDQLDIKLDD